MIRQEAELSKEEWLEAVPLFMQKMQTYQPQYVSYPILSTD